LTKSEFLGNLIQGFGEMDVLYPDGYGYEELAKHILLKMEKLGIKPPCVDGDKCQFLLHRYIDPSFYYWDEDFEEKFGDEFREFMEKRKK
jgi:hypothetical protein